MTFQRIVVVGTTGSGKTTLASEISKRLGIAHIELDSLNWGPNWTMRQDEEFLAAVDEATRADTWVVDGNYSRSREIVWPRADSVIWLDYPLAVILWRLWWRIWRRGLRKEVLWNNNQERILVHFFTRDSLFLWALKTHSRRKREYSVLLYKPENEHLSVVHLHRPGQTERWLATLA